MPLEIIMPSLGMVSDLSTLVSWQVNIGDEVQVGQVLFTAESEKATIEIEAAEKGVVYRLLAKEGEIIPTGETIAILLLEGETSEAYEKVQSSPNNVISEIDRKAETEEEQDKKDQSRILISPQARKVAIDEGISLEFIQGSGPNGRIVFEDVEKAILSKRDLISNNTAQLSPINSIRQIISDKMVSSKQTTASVTLVTEVNASKLVEVFNSYKDREQESSYTLMMVIIVGLALSEHKVINSSITKNGVIGYSSVNIGIAVDSPQGLLVPVLRKVTEKSLKVLSKEYNDLISRANKGRITPEEMIGATFTITNLGMYGVDAFTPIINLPECAILGVGRIQRKPVLNGNEIIPGHLITLSLSFDHRLVDGGPAARFLQRISEIIENPMCLKEEE